MNLYFDADILLGKRAGIYRYSKEIAQRFGSDRDVSCRPISSKQLGSAPFNGVLDPVFGKGADIYERYHRTTKAGLVEFVRDHRDTFEKYQRIASSEMNLWLKFRMKIARARYSSEKKLIKRPDVQFHFGRKCPIVYAPYGPLPNAILKANPRVFKTQVIYDLIPILYREYFDNTRVFDAVYSTLSKIDLIITISDSTRNDLIRLRPDIDPEKIVSIPIAASDHFVPINSSQTIARVKAKYGIPQESDYVFSVSTVEPRKNQLNMIRAWSEIYASLNLHKPKLVIAGRRGWGQEYLDALDACGEVGSTVIFTGFVDDEDLPALYSGSTITAYPTLYEGFGIPVLESMGCGRFCVTSNRSSIPEIVGSEIPMVNPESLEEIGELMLKAINDIEFRTRMEQISLDRAREFSWDKTYSRTKELLLKRSEEFYS